MLNFCFDALVYFQVLEYWETGLLGLGVRGICHMDILTCFAGV